MPLYSLDEVIKIRKKLQSENKKVVFTNGCFEILHKGHVEYLSRARELGDFLIVAVNSDSSIKLIKGEKRPIIPAEDRAFVIANLKPVDAVFIFEEETPKRIIDLIIPDVLVKGGDYVIETIVGHKTVLANGGIVKTIPLTEGKSTSDIFKLIIERFKDSDNFK
ncbi:D-glycero-beta-D-manno-heptose 1-phosphate adenylyltransferase [candidate division KSB1 bacterium]